MGVKNLWDIPESCKKTSPLHHLQNKRPCIDPSCWMVQLHIVTKSHGCTKVKVYLRGLFHHPRALISLNCSPSSSSRMGPFPPSSSLLTGGR